MMSPTFLKNTSFNVRIQQIMNRFITLLIFLTLLVSCGKSTKVVLSAPRTKALKADQSLSEKLFLIGSVLDSNNVEIIAECDCCTSDFAFLNDSTFVYVNTCVHGDQYFKGKYISFCNTLLVKFDELSVDTNWEPDETDSTIAETINLQSHITVEHSPEVYDVFRLSQLKSRTVISTCLGASCEYGVEKRKQTLNDFIHDLKELKIWKKLQLH